ncbi:hypothetical protein OH708_07440 [Pseudomonas capsici]|uniref:hypothetical protein n=1 Tax=Pseudomonas capsici TaxID=2810614 RepID=UPI0021F1D683|nr:hypothetical protein [Pseudomonas capsici]MCV4287738.1 hypothetical protein [Pseudomonas capsici]
MKTKVGSLNEAMQWTRGALNCFIAAKLDGQAHIAGYVTQQAQLARSLLEEARSLPSPYIP